MKYHREVFFEVSAPRQFSDFLAALPPVLSYTHHAKLQTINDRYGIIPVLRADMLRASDVFEYVKDGGAVEKLVFRIDWLSERFSYSYSVSADGKVVTCWANEKTDVHGTLDRRAYATE